MVERPGFADFHRSATGETPDGYRCRLAETGLPATVDAPSGTGRAAVVLAWLWRLRHADRAGTPRRLVYALPPVGLVERVAAELAGWLTRLGLADEIPLHVVGGLTGDVREWRLSMHRPAVVVGALDALVSKALNRGTGLGRTGYPIDFALVTNGTQWIVEDDGECPAAITTLRRTVALAARHGTAEPFRLTRVTVARRSVDHLPSGTTMGEVVRARHVAGTVTLVVANTVASAQEHYRTVRGFGHPCLLLHPWFRGHERERLVAALSDPAGRIVVTTQVLDVGARLVLAEPAPRPAPTDPPPPDLVALFDTGPDLDTGSDLDAGSDLDPSVYLGTAPPSDVDLVWARWDGAAPPGTARWPEARWRCRVPLADAIPLLGRVPVWRRDPAADGWARVDADRPPSAGETLLLAADSGGYDPDVGFDPSVTAPVAECPPLVPAVPTASTGAWMSLTQHLEETRDHARALIGHIRPAVSAATVAAVVRAAYLHDVGKSHPIWQDALCALAGPETRELVEGGRPWAKSGIDAPLRFRDDVEFRHELASLLLLDGPLAGLLADIEDPDLVRYLVLAHHGRLRTHVPAADGRVAGLVHGETADVPVVLGLGPSTLTVDLAGFTVDGSWAATVAALLERYGPFVLAYLETLVRIADWRASAGLPVGRGDTAGT